MRHQGACNTGAGVQTLGGYACDQQVQWHGCGTDFVKAGCSSCNTQSGGGSGSGGPSSNTVAPAALEVTGAAAQTNTLHFGGSPSSPGPVAPDCSIQCEADATAANYCVDGHWVSVAAAANTGKCDAASAKSLSQQRSIDCMPESSEHPSSCLVRRDDAQGVHKASSTMATPLYDVLKAHGGLVQGAFMPTKDAVADQVTCSRDASDATCTFTVGLRHY